MPNKFYLTKEGLKKLEREYQELKKTRESRIAKSAPAPFYSDELNAEFVAFKEDLDYLDGRMLELEHILKNFELIKFPPLAQRDQIGLGAEITMEIHGKTNKFKMVGTLEADPSLGKISNESPVGQMLMGCRKGETVVISAPTKVSYKIKKISYGKQAG